MPLIISFLRFSLSWYFWAISLLFRFRNFFNRRRIVDKATNEVLLISAGEAAAMIRRGDIGSLQLVDAYIERIRHVNGMLNAVVAENFAHARTIAENIDNYLSLIDKNSEEFANLAKTKPLFGVPFTVKDNTFCKGFVCTAGVPARRQNEPCAEDAEAVKRIRDAGAILLAITNVPELALWWETSNKLFGTTNNPYDVRRTPGGSSGGEGALIAAAGSVIGLGNDVGGSLRVPAVFCGIFGLKPGPGVVPSSGIIPHVRGGYVTQMASAGPMSRYASDLALLLQILAGEDIAQNRLRLQQPVNFKHVRIFYMEEIKPLVCENLSNEMRHVVRKTAKYFEKKYDISTHRLDLLLAHHAHEMFLTSLDEDDYEKITMAMSNSKYDVNCVIELIKCPFGLSDHTLPAIFTGMRSKLPKKSEASRKFINSKRDQLRREIIDLLGTNGILIFPAWPTTAPFHNQPLLTPMNIGDLKNFKNQSRLFLVYTALWNTLALPVLTCPMGINSEGLPVAVQIICAPDSERLLLAAAQDLEEGFGGWTPPEPPGGWRQFVRRIVSR
uniref:Amidase domain-containing protein n=1 Tax=Meloidogyne hapla TaxID=6305 RepID=A0A1I8B093_MELHA